VLPEDKYPEVWEADRAIDFIRSQKVQPNVVSVRQHAQAA